jgi:uroporphyrinogen decarboxylase
LPDIERAGFLPTLIEFSRQQLKYEGRATCPGMEPFAIASSTTGVQQFCLWMKKKPDLCHHLLRLAVEHRLQVLDYWIDTFGLKNVRYATATGPESNYVISPAAFEEFVLPYTKEVHEKVLARGIKSIFCHICGEHNPNLPHWKKIPFGEPGMISLGPEMDFEKVAEYFGRDTIVMGNISPTVILTSSPEELYEQTRTCLEKGKKALKRFVLMTGCELPVITPPYNLWVMRKAVSDFGWYE